MVYNQNIKTEIKLIEFIRQFNLLNLSDCYLLGVSGGVDSMLLLHFMDKFHYNFSVAHANFKLRGQESDRDEDLVRTICKQKKITIHTKSFNTSKYAKEHNVSLEMAARELRYCWFEELCTENGYSKIIIAHNKNDHTETVLLNLSRGTSLKGLRGLKPLSGNIVRPMLCLSRNEIENYAKDNEITYIFDSSNKNIRIKRNRIRQKVIPELLKVNSDLIDSVYKNSFYLREIELFLERSFENIIKKIVKKESDIIKIKYKTIEFNEFKGLLFYHIFSSLGFSSKQVHQIELLKNSQTGRYIKVNNFEVFKNRDELVIIKNHKREFNEVKIDENSINSTIILNDISIYIRKIISVQPENLKNPACAYFDFSKIIFPLILRNWRNGDKFIPFGFKGQRLISDFLTDLKIPSFLKKSIKVVESNGDILWIVGIRINDKYKITDSTESILFLSAEMN